MEWLIANIVRPYTQFFESTKVDDEEDDYSLFYLSKL